MDAPESAGRLDSGPGSGLGQRQASAASSKRLSRGTQGLLLLGLGALLAIGALIGPMSFRRPAGSTAETAREAAPDNGFRPTPRQWASFSFARVEAQTFRAVSETEGKIANDDDRTTPVFSPYSGRVIRLLARSGDHVKAGDPLLVVQATELVQAANDLIAAEATLTTAKAQLNLARTNEKRQHALFQAQGAALKDWQQSQVDLANAEGGERGAEIALGSVRNRLRILGKPDAEIDAMAAAPDPLHFSPEAVVASPINGTIVQRQVGLGQYIVSQGSGGTVPVFSIGDLSKVWLLANARETDAPLIHLDDALEVRVLAYPERVFRARITYIASSIDPATHRLPVRAEVDNPDGALKPEMFAQYSIITGPESASPAVPDSAIVHEGGIAHVWVARPDDRTIVSREIQTGRAAGGMVQVTEGLRAGEMVVTRGSLFIDRATEGD